MPQVLIVSNRLPVSVKKQDGELVFSSSVGGLATGLSSYVNDRRNQWIGWPGIASDELTEDDRQTITKRLAEHNCSPVFLSKRQIDDFYNGFSNDILWPLFHNLPFEDVDSARHKRLWQAYRTVNKLFAEAVLNRAQTNSNIWVHDYQLLLMPELLRQETASATIGFFLHIPFPTAKAFAKLPEHKKLLSGMLGADLLGFHTSRYVADFLENCQTADLGTIGEGHVTLANRTVRVGNFPMGIDYEKYAAAGRTSAVKAAVRRYRTRYRGQKIIAAVDRMDPSKGLVERLVAYRDFLAANPRLHGKVVFAMIAAPSRTDIAAYQQLSQKLDTLVAEINQTYGSVKWQPVDYMNTTQPFEEVTALFQVANVAFIAPLKDGMNLAAKEFVASNKGGALILSETAGAAEELRDALIVNPRKPASLVNALQESLSMPKSEVTKRLHTMQRHLSTNTVQVWAKNFVDTLQKPVPGTQPRAKTLNGTAEAILVHDYARARKRLLLLDYDGSLVAFQEDASTARPPQSLLHCLKQLTADPHNEVVIVSGRAAADLEGWLGHLPLSLVAEHGGAIRKRGHKRWQAVDRSATKWRKEILPIMQTYADLTPKAHVEEKLHSLVWHYRAAPPYYAQKYAVVLKRDVRPLLKRYGLKLFQGNKILEIKDPRISKDVAISEWLGGVHDFVLIIGDDFTDEDMFRVAPPDSYTIKVGRGRTYAGYRLKSSLEVKRLLKLLTK